MDRISSYNRKYSLAGYLLLLVLLLPSFVLLILNGYGEIPSLVSDIRFLKQTGLSLALTAACTLASLILAFPAIAIYARCGTGLRNFLRVFLAFSFCFPPALMGICLDTLIGKGGYIAEIQMATFIRSSVICLMLNIPLLTVMVGEHWRRLDSRCENDARTLGASRLRIFRTITLPKIRPALFGASALVFLRCMMAPENPIISAFISLVILAVLVSSEKNISRTEAPDASYGRKRRGNVFSVFLSFIYMTAVLALLLGPACSMILRSVFNDGKFSFGIYKTMFSALDLDWLVALGFSLALALVSSLIAAFISVRISVGVSSSGSGTYIAMIPFAAGPLVLAAGLSGVYAWIEETLAIKMVLTLICHVLILTSVQTMIMLPAVRSVRRTYRETSLSLGSSSGRSFRHIDLRIIAPAVRTAVLTSVALSIACHGPAELYGLNTTFAQIQRLSAKGDIASACAMGSVLLVLCFLFFSLGIGHSREGKQHA
ncbi:MAG: hypothetical protein ILP16_11810 [Spirochaetales bacterium]|nr:hypothetical protein [Spirochaetales bacterium]